MAKDVKFNIKLNIDGREHVVEVSTDLKEMTKKISEAKTNSDKLRDSLIKFNQIGQAFQSAMSGLQNISNVLQTYANANAVQIEAEAKLANNMRNTMNAREEDIQSIKDLCSEQQKLGVIGDEVQLAGAQELATYLSKKSSLEKLIPVMNDMVAQQYGFNATQESAATIATMLGKVMDGQTKALSRYGYTFTDAQEQILKFGDEEQRAATLADVISASVGGANAALAQTDAGKAKQVANAFGDIKENVGKALVPLQYTLQKITSGVTVFLIAHVL
jgi:DNA polymerase III alpha subunit (gram-positive type)